MRHQKLDSVVTKGHLTKDELIEFIRDTKNGDLYLVIDYGVYLGKVEASEIKLYDDDAILEPQFIQEVRIFNKQKEIKISRINDRFVWRERKDTNEGKEETTCFDETYKLWGQVTAHKENWSILTEQRGTSIAIPDSYEKGQKVGLVFRKYIEFQDWDLVNDQPFSYQVVDDRLVKYALWKEEKENE
ncbi:type III-D CRISPR-associated protein Csx19 [Virgibacillus proomii]|uniref:type III-D CRISPR-associated protein Csx19 n=1 Tax=Virgibacillus proomii TaxID=84407 RepID=UPI001C11270A|nr:CRISPR-associated protein Csx19 [Virgibacillus proomii]MBU5266438.1 TIGR03984 family CRISPR-associated protein [Virgibacillus proomii]